MWNGCTAVSTPLHQSKIVEMAHIWRRNCWRLHIASVRFVSKRNCDFLNLCSKKVLKCPQKAWPYNRLGRFGCCLICASCFFRLLCSNFKASWKKIKRKVNGHLITSSFAVVIAIKFIHHLFKRDSSHELSWSTLWEPQKASNANQSLYLTIGKL